MKKLTDNQLKFLQMIVKLNNDPLADFTHGWPDTVRRVIYKRYYNDNEALGLNLLVKDYLKWRNKQ